MHTTREAERRRLARIPSDSSADLIWKDESGQRTSEQGTLIDISFGGMAIRTSQPIAAASSLIVRAHVPKIVALAQVRHCSWDRSIYRVGVRFVVKAQIEPPCDGSEPEYHGFLRMAASGIAGDRDRIERLYRALSFRYHPDNRDTGDSEIFLSIRETYRIAFGARHANHAAADETSAGNSQNEPNKSRTERDRRRSVLALLYRKRMTDCGDASLSLHDLAAAVGVASTELTFTLWYLREKGHVMPNDSCAYAITVNGVDSYEEAGGDDTFSRNLPVTDSCSSRRL